MKRLLTTCCLTLCLVLGVGHSHAHQPSQGFILIDPPQTSDTGLTLTGRWDLALVDLDRVLQLDADGDGQVRGRELDAGRERIQAWARSGIVVATSATCNLEVAYSGVTTRLDGPYAVLALDARCTTPSLDPEGHAHIAITQSGLFANDPTHRALVRMGDSSAVLRADAPRASLALTEADALDTLATYVKEGVLHIWEGIDHVFFLLALLLPAVLVRRQRDPAVPTSRAHWEPATRLRPVLVEVLKVVTAFTIAHSITLVLSTIGVVRVGSVAVETAIAMSVALAALNNVWPVLDARWTVAFALGLLHGFGFSSVLLELGLPDEGRALALAGFNVGVELGQLAIVLVLVPLTFALRRYRAFRLVGVVGVSLVIAAIALYWSLERIGLI